MTSRLRAGRERRTALDPTGEGPESRPTSAARRWWPTIRLLVSVALLAFVISRLDLGRAAEILSTARVELIGLAVLVGLAGRFFAALRWYILLRALESDIPYRGVLRLSFIGMFLHFLPAGSLASEVARVYGLNRTTSDLAGSLASVLVDRMLGLAALVTVALVGLAFAPPGVPPLLSDLAWVGFVLVTAAGFLIVNRTARRALDRLFARVGLEATRRRLSTFNTRIDVMRSRPAHMGWSVVAALVSTAFRILPAWLVAIALGIDVSLLQLFIIIPLIYLAAQVPISVGGLGVREVGWVALLRLIEVPAADAIVMSLLLATLIFVVSLPGAWLYARHGLEAPGPGTPDAGPPDVAIAEPPPTYE